MSFPIIPQNLSISAMRSSGYRDTAHALAELIDNSVQAGLEANNPSFVEVICIEKSPSPDIRPRIDRIAVLDNSGGMSAVTLRLALQFGNGTRLDPKKHTGIGKFGMGLPNSSISQGKRVDVWTWQKGNVYHTYIDVEEISNNQMTEVPDPNASTLPSEWLSLFANGMPENGTLVVWSKLDRVSWKQGTTLLRHLEFLSGRVYRRFINERLLRIRLASFESSSAGYSPRYESFVRPNDPMFLMTGTNTPAPYDQTPAFAPFGSTQSISIGLNDSTYEVTIKASIAKQEARMSGGSKAFGQHAKRNQGVSVLRAGRELELNKSFELVDARERWWGVEVEFPPGLDDVFGVTNNKQSATGFYRMIIADDAEAEGVSAQEYKKLLVQEGDPRLPMYEISEEIEKTLRELRTAVNKMREGELIASKTETLSAKVEKSATASVRKRRERIGSTGRSDRQEEEQNEEVRAQSLTADIVDDGVEHKVAREIAIDYVKKHTKFRVRHADLPTAAMFDVVASGGVIVLTFNTRHPVHAKLFDEFRKTEQFSGFAKDLLAMIMAWARMEDEAASPQIKDQLQEVRELWGRTAKDFIEASEA
ncbi:ATP-binding protein [Rhizobium leguminosarum]|uniref:ATP-binding protein n=1 Tax=Rhizobium leguminosarum TaxID=384 RepID=UPI00103B75A9|nr:ATP-binding protein [Rhizobium leguminosarum]TBY46629.1 ATP-binding protein [Rhizobium leguminosarum bv. viciae]